MLRTLISISAVFAVVALLALAVGPWALAGTASATDSCGCTCACCADGCPESGCCCAAGTCGCDGTCCDSPCCSDDAKQAAPAGCGHCAA